MNRNKIFLILGCLAVCGIVFAALAEIAWIAKMGGPGDLRTRTNEILCSHEGINPIRVFNREIETARFKGGNRPDFPNEQTDKLTVHAYPPWHTAYAWFYGSIPFPYVIAFVYLLSGIALTLIWTVVRGFIPKDRYQGFFLLSFVLLFIGYPIFNCLRWGNYSVIIAALAILMYKALEKEKEIVAGFCWALMMTKPQVALLFFWPLFWTCRFRAIVVSIGVCLAATLWPAYVYKESPIDLILQIPSIGAPFVGGYLRRFVSEDVAKLICNVWMVICFVGCGFCTYLLRRAKPSYILYLPALVFFPIWTYSQSADHVVAFLIPVLLGLSALKGNKIAFVVCLIVILSGFEKYLWFVLVNTGSVNPRGLGWITTGTGLFMTAALTIGMLYLVEKSHEAYSEH